MSYRDTLRRVSINGRDYVGASFRGVPFFVESADGSGGRRAVVHEFPGRDDPFVEDLGRAARSFRFEGYVIGDDYQAQRDALLDVLEASGAGELVHPYRGVLRAICVKHQYRESLQTGGMAAFSIDFAEAPAQAVAPSVVVDSAAQVATSADATVGAVRAELVEQFDTAGMPAFALESAEVAMTNATAAIGAKLAPLIADTQELAEFTGRVALLTARAASLVRQPASAIDGFREAITGLANTLEAAPGAVLDALFEAYSADLGAVVTATTAIRTRELANQTALVCALRSVIALEAARLAPLVPYATLDDALAARDKVAELLDEQAAAANDIAYPAIVELRSQVMRAVPGGNAFAEVIPVERKVPIPSLLLTYQLYGAVELEADVVTRNAIRHPGFVVGTLKVLSDG